MGNKRCTACHRVFHPCPQVPEQSFCSALECQRERRRRWQQKKRRDDPAYRDNDSRYGKDWSAKNPEYWKRYREDHPNYTDRNRRQQQSRNQKQRALGIAKVDASVPISSMPSGRYRLTLVAADGIANEDMWIAEIAVLSSTYDESGGDCKVRT
ncbi:MAG: hypothetical protein PHY45_01120 [Rhodocyclaceae bacterium]|nr:hypothetical protein [Rhodocyclaceae bacterium]